MYLIVHITLFTFLFLSIFFSFCKYSFYFDRFRVIYLMLLSSFSSSFYPFHIRFQEVETFFLTEPKHILCQCVDLVKLRFLQREKKLIAESYMREPLILAAKSI